MKHNRIILLILALLFAVGQQAWAQVLNHDEWSVWDGSSTSEPTMNDKTVYINSAAELAWVTENENKKLRYKDIVLNVNLDMSNGQWDPIGTNTLWGEIGPEGWDTDAETGYPYNGHFYGNNHTIRLRINGTDDNYQGLFGYIGSDGVVSDLHVEGKISCRKSRLVGGIAGLNRGTIRNCWVSADVSSDWRNSSSALGSKVAGIVGENGDGGTIEYCCMTGNVSNNDDCVGGIAGKNYRIIKHCTLYGAVHTTYEQEDILVGGIW